MAEPVRPSQPAARNTAPAAGKKPTSKKGGGKREEITVAISSQVYGLVKNYKIDSGDNVLPKISGVLRATGALVHELLQEVKEAHLTHGLADDLFYASMLIENEAKETLKNFMIKSSKGKADQEDKVLSLQKLYVPEDADFFSKRDMLFRHAVNSSTAHRS